jgi:hypothetical protein
MIPIALRNVTLPKAIPIIPKHQNITKDGER